MDTKIKNFLGLALIIGVLLLGASAFYYTHAYANSIGAGSYRAFEVTGEGKVVAVPDVATFSFKVLTEGDMDIPKLQSANSQKVNKAIEFLKKNKVDKKDIETVTYNVTPRYSRCDYKKIEILDIRAMVPEIAPVEEKCVPEIVGYSISQQVSVKVRDFKKVGDILAGVVSNGANTVSQLNMDIDDRTDLENEARKKAIAEAKSKAEAYAKAGDFRLGKLLSISEDGYFPIYGKGGARAEAMSFDAVSSAPVIEAGSQEVVINVRLNYAIR